MSFSGTDSRRLFGVRTVAQQIRNPFTHKIDLFRLILFGRYVVRAPCAMEVGRVKKVSLKMVIDVVEQDSLFFSVSSHFKPMTPIHRQFFRELKHRFFYFTPFPDSPDSGGI